MQQRNIGVSIFLSIITCGIYAIYWFIVLSDDTNNLSGHNTDGTSGGVAFLLTIVTCGIYGIYWAYKQGEKINEAKVQRGMAADSSSSILYLVLQIFGFGIVAYALMQNEINKMVPPAQTFW